MSDRTTNPDPDTRSTPSTRECCNHPLNPRHAHAAVRCRARGPGISSHRWGVPDPSSLSAVLAQPSRTGGVQPDGAGPQQRVMRLDTARPGWFPPGDDSDEGSGTKATTTQTATQPPDPAPPPLQSARRRRRLFTMLLTFKPHTTAGRQRDPATHHRTAPPNESFLNQCGAVKIACKPQTNRPSTTPRKPDPPRFVADEMNRFIVDHHGPLRNLCAVCQGLDIRSRVTIRAVHRHLLSRAVSPDPPPAPPPAPDDP